MIEEIEFPSAGTVLRGSHHTTPNAQATVVFLTGDGTSGSQSSTWPSLTSAMLSTGLNVCIFDFHSQGKSDGERSELTLQRATQNFEDFLQFLDTQGTLRTNRTYCLGSSFGAAVLLNSPKHFSRFQKISLKSPAFDLSRAYDREIEGISNLKAWKENGVHPDLGLPFTAYEEAISSNGFAGLLKIDCPVLITIGSEDEIVGVEDCQKASYLRDDVVQLEVLSGVLHNYKQEGAKENFERFNAEFFGAEI